MAKNLIYGFSSTTNFQEIIKKLNIISDLDIDIIHLPPFFPACEDAVVDFMDIDPEVGTEDELKDLIKKANAKNIKVYMELPITHASIKHPWFKDHPEYFMRRRYPNENWENIDEGPAFSYDEELKEYYLQQFGEGTADLRWYIANYPFESMVDNFRKIISHWYFAIGIHGFYIPCPQVINFKISEEEQQPTEYFFSHRAIEVISRIFDWSEYSELFERPGLIVELSDPTNEIALDLYAEELNALVVNLEIRDQIEPLGILQLNDLEYPELSVLRLEDRNNARFPAKDKRKMLWDIFNTNAQNIYLLEGQELGLENPSPKGLPLKDVLAGDLRIRRFYEREIKSADSYHEREIIAKIARKKSCANVRITINEEEYNRQKNELYSPFNTTRTAIDKWRKDY